MRHARKYPAHVADFDPEKVRTAVQVPIKTAARVPRVKMVDFDPSGHPRLKEAVAAVYEWADEIKVGNVGASMIFVGPNGTGKTMLSRIILWSLVIQATNEVGEPLGMEVPAGRFFTADYLIKKLGDGRPYHLVNPDSDPVVIIDDIGSETAIPFVSNQAEERRVRYHKIMDHLYVFNIPVVITSNLSVAELASWVGPRAWDRLMEKARKGFIVDLAGVPSWRVRAGGR